MEEVVEVLKYVLPAVVVLIATVLITGKHLSAQYKEMTIKMNVETKKETLLLRLQAYERLIIFLERVKPSNLVLRNQEAEYTSADLYLLILSNLRSEFEHNLSQQIYVSREAWSAVCFARDEVMKVIGMAVKQTNLNLPATELAKKLIQIENDLESYADSPNRAINILKTEAQELF